MRTMMLMAALAASGLLAALLASREPQAVAPRAQAVAPPPAHAASAAAPAFVRSMQGTRPDGTLRQDAGNALSVDAELGHLFDYYLSALGEQNLPAIRREVGRVLELRLAPGAAVQAKQLLERYLAYKQALVALEQGLGGDGDSDSDGGNGNASARAAQRRLTAMRQLRRSFFNDADNAGLFGASDARDADAVARMAIAQDGALTAAQKAARLAALDRALAPALRADREAPLHIVRTEELARTLRDQGAGDDAVYRLRAQQLSPEAAGRLAQLDLEEAAWRGRIAQYLGQRSMLGDEQARQQLRARLFTEQELRRLPAYE